jgi:hypothetical protein
MMCFLNKNRKIAVRSQFAVGGSLHVRDVSLIKSPGRLFIYYGTVFARYGSLFAGHGSSFARHGRPFAGCEA